MFVAVRAGDIKVLCSPLWFGIPEYFNQDKCHFKKTKLVSGQRRGVAPSPLVV